MVSALIVSNVMLWLVVVALAATVLALLRQVGMLHERVAPVGALTPASGLRIGAAAPVLEVLDWNRRALRIGAAKDTGRSTLLLFVAPSCPVCKTVLSIVDSIMKREQGWLDLVLASDGAVPEHEAFVRELRLAARWPYVLSEALGLAYQVGKLPYAVLIDAAGVVRARGLVNNREHLESLFEASELGIGTLQEYLTQSRSVA